ncbi:hypothetical protein X797_003984 [Metarhizium robertsii]|uniref:Uncharacterized protein n=1 Tax=Metarhizium robertsii TaxID=568076 RepID=A0A0A1UZQ5_9HYPO|nr:hypothetical protein X797_003984 [Metarhizium robertsii]
MAGVGLNQQHQVHSMQVQVVVGSQLHPSAPASIPLAFQPLQLPCVNGIDAHGLRRWPLQVAPGYDTVDTKQHNRHVDGQVTPAIYAPSPSAVDEKERAVQNKVKQAIQVRVIIRFREGD